MTIAGDSTTAFHDTLEFLASAVETDLDRKDTHAQEFGDLGCGEPMGLVQQDDSTIVIGQEVEAALYARAGFFSLDNFEHGGRRGYRKMARTLGVHGRMTLALTQAIEAHMSSDTV